MTPSDTSKFDKEEIAAVLDANQIPRATFVEADGRCVSLPYHNLNECIFASKDKTIYAFFGEFQATITGGELTPIFDALCAHKLAKIQAVIEIDSVTVERAKQEESAPSDDPTD